MAHLRGSQSIAQLSDVVIGLERNQQAEEGANEATVRVLKNRISGDTGVACVLVYDKETGRLNEKDTSGFSEDTDDDIPF